jgi:predicted pyridoxine 5'-phosphate oxidase superfamily flavin-nucleotide-binding protein
MTSDIQTGLFHEGELAVQRQAGVEEQARQVGRMIHAHVPADFGAFLGERQFLILASHDQRARMWASLIAGHKGFVTVPDDTHVVVAAAPSPGDPLESALQCAPAQIGLLAIEFATRQRIRLNGVARRIQTGIALTVAQAYGNCSKYIQRRVPAGATEAAGPTEAAEAVGPAEPQAARPRESAALDARQAAVVRGADTFFVASSHPERGADASHRGGRPGFVDVAADGRSLTFPDYAGNHMFQTLGNLTVNPSIGLLWLNWSNGSSVQVTGRASIIWDRRVLESRPGARRLVEVAIDAVLEHDHAMPASWMLIEAYGRNP